MIDTVKERFGIERVILVGDRAMITDAHAATLKELGAGFVSALKSAQIRKLIGTGDLQLSLFDQTNLAEITSSEFPGERLVVCRNPHLAAERARKARGPAGQRPSASWTRSRRWSTNPRGRLHRADAGKIGAARRPRDQQVQGRQALRAADRRRRLRLPAQDRADRAARPRSTGSTCSEPPAPTEQLTTQAVVRVYKQLKMAERAYRTIKDALDVRPIRHHLQDRVEAHFFLFLLAYYLLFELQARLAPMLFTDDTPLTPADPVAPARRSAAANTKAGSRPHPRRTARLQPPRPDRRARHHLPQPTTHRRQRTHLPAPHQHQPGPSQSARPAQRQTRQVAKAKPARNTRIPRQHAGFLTSTPKTSV